MVKNELIVDGELDFGAVHHLRRKQGLVGSSDQNPPLIPRDNKAAITLKRSGDIQQGETTIGKIRDMGATNDGMEHYEVLLPGGQQLARISFSNPVDEFEFTVETTADGLWHSLRRELPGTMRAEAGSDRNAEGLKRVIPWLIEKGYL